MDPQQVVSNDCETQKDYIDDARLKKMMKETQPSFMERYGSCLVTFVLIAINVVVFGIEVVLNGFNPDISSLVLFDMGAMFAPAIQGQGDLYRFVTPMFLHVDVMHLLFNMAALYSAGASTSIFGLFVAIALLGVLSKKNRAFLSQYSKGMLSVIGLNIAYTLLMPSVSLSGHLGGALGGLIGMFMVPSKNLRVPAAVRAVVSVLWLCSLVYLGFWLGLAG